MIKHATLAIIAALVTAGSAYAHATLEQPLATPGKAYKAVVRIGHGCGKPAQDGVWTARTISISDQSGWLVDLQVLINDFTTVHLEGKLSSNREER